MQNLLYRCLSRLGHLRASIAPWSRRFPALPADAPAEEELVENYNPKYFYPACIGELLGNKYELVCKLGFGVLSTVWFARRVSLCNESSFVALKICASLEHEGKAQEVAILQHIASVNGQHPGRQYIRLLEDTFSIMGPHGPHICMVFAPLRESLSLFPRYIDGGMNTKLVSAYVKMLLRALDYLHTECHVIHADIKPCNIMLTFQNDIQMQEIADHELRSPSARKELVDRVIYESKTDLPGRPRFWPPKLIDFSHSTRVTPEQSSFDYLIGSEQYMAPEITIDAPWSYPVDIWSVGILAGVFVLLILGRSYTVFNRCGIFWKTSFHLMEDLPREE